MEVHSTVDRTVFKFIHNDKTETAIKSTSGCDGLGVTARDKYTVFASCSYGCQAHCKFCMLHSKGIQYRSVHPVDTLRNLALAMERFAGLRPDETKKALKLSWMSMGEPLYHASEIRDISFQLIDWALKTGLASSLDSVDIGTSLPAIENGRFLTNLEAIYDLSRVLGRFQRLDASRPRVRIFASVMSAKPETREFLIGKSYPVVDVLRRVRRRLRTADGSYGEIIVHHLLLEGQNDSPEEVEAMISLMREPGIEGTELRILRYNQRKDSLFSESPRFDEMASRFAGALPKVKVQASPGSEVMAACGQFLLGEFLDAKAQGSDAER